MKRRAVLRTLGEKLLDLGNLAAAALLFGKALAPQEVPALALVIGGIAFVGLYAFGIILVYLGEGSDSMTELTWFLTAIVAAALAMGVVTLLWVRYRETH
jgi:phosphate/sulfate permease